VRCVGDDPRKLAIESDLLVGDVESKLVMESGLIGGVDEKYPETLSRGVGDSLGEIEFAPSLKRLSE